MSKSGYGEDLEPRELVRWRVAVATSLRSEVGQAFLRELLAALDALPARRLISGWLQNRDEVCALGAVGQRRGIDMKHINVKSSEEVGRVLGISAVMAAEIEYINDEGGYLNDEGGYHMETPERRWERVRAWVATQLPPTAAGGVCEQG